MHAFAPQMSIYIKHIVHAIACPACIYMNLHQLHAVDTQSHAPLQALPHTKNIPLGYLAILLNELSNQRLLER